MALTGTRTYVGFGFGAIQSGLFLYEAFRSGAFGRLVVAEVMPDVVQELRRNEGFFTINIAHDRHIEQARIGPITIENPAEQTDRERLIAAVSAAEEIGTAVPSVAFYAGDHPGSLHRILAEGLRQKAAYGGPRAVIYAAENHNHAAEILQEKVIEAIPPPERDAVLKNVRFLNTVIGKMSGVIGDPTEMNSYGLRPVTPQGQRAFLVEAFNRILISRVQFEETGLPFQRGIDVFEEKDDLLPFEEAKLYGHNATHALAAYIGAARGLRYIADLVDVPGVMTFLRHAFIDESGAALIRKYGGVDPLFTSEGYQGYADDLLKRMTNPLLHDTIERVGRDPARKLGWDDRLIGTMRLALNQGVQPRRYALGAAAALTLLAPDACDHRETLEVALDPIWRSSMPTPGEQQALISLLLVGCESLRRWRERGLENLESLFSN